MAVTVTPIFAGTTLAIFTVEATADADVAAVVPHGLAAAPLKVTLVPLAPQFYTSAWQVGLVDGVNVNLVKANAVGSGVAGDQVRVLVELPHSIVQ